MYVGWKITLTANLLKGAEKRSKHASEVAVQDREPFGKSKQRQLA